MASVHKSPLVAHGAEQMFALVEPIDGYPPFQPRCGSARAGKVGFDLNNELRSRAPERVSGPVSSAIAGIFINAFGNRAESVYRT